ncbi:MAG: acylphosphatase [Cyanobacteria bacterium]|nr:acylphosphatase [Cyanobacteriota bacterium]
MVLNQRVAKHLFISGLVQGVGYRYHFQKQARLMGVVGWCRNVEDGCVEAVIVGPNEVLNQLVQWCHQGPEHANVESVSEQLVSLDEVQSLKGGQPSSFNMAEEMTDFWVIS